MRRFAFLVLALPLAACHKQQTARSEMWTHYQRVGAIQQAVIAGDLHIAQANAFWVARNVPSEGMPENAGPYVESMRTAARAVAGAPDLAEAAMATARMGAVCGSCHAALQRGPTITVEGVVPMANDTVVQQMQLHLWSLTRMWDGLTGPSDRSWTHGALGLNSAPHYQEHIEEGGAPAQAMAHRLHALGQQAAMAGSADRVVIYGEFLSTCSSCHQHFQVRLPRASSP